MIFLLILALSVSFFSHGQDTDAIKQQGVEQCTPQTTPMPPAQPKAQQPVIISINTTITNKTTRTKNGSLQKHTEIRRVISTNNSTK